ncbi:MAG: tRNA dihydrouridine synthase DusB [Halanaerobiales bacterium]|nr:tRNA dihydrouridine synthase DusB [Halanaerobiales bacterium]
MQIGNLMIETPVFLAPMAGISDYPYRQLIREMGGQLLYTEMISSKGLVYGNERSRELIDFNRREKGLIAVQIFGEDPVFMREAAAILAVEYQPDLIDLNMGCPMPKIVKSGSGSALLQDAKRAGEIMAAVVNAVKLPVTVKIRAGWDRSRLNAVEIAQLAEEKGVKAVAVHARTRDQFYLGKADWQIIQLVKEKVNIPVIGNGDIFSPEDAGAMITGTGCDAVMIGRAVRGNPWLIHRTSHFLQTGEVLAEPDCPERIKTALSHLEGAVAYFGERLGIPRMRKHLAWYLKGLPHSTSIKERIFQLNQYQQVAALLKEYLHMITGPAER